MSARVLPKGWREVRLGDLVAESGGSIQTGPFGSALHASDYIEGGIPCVMPANIGDNVIVEAGIARISAMDHERLKRHHLRQGDIVYSRRGDVERRALVRPENDGWLCGTGCLRVRFGEGQNASSSFVSYALGTDESRTWIVQHAVGATMLNLNTSILGGVPLVVPPLAEQRAIAEVLGALDDKIAANETLSQILSQSIASEWQVLARRSPLGTLGDLVRLDYGKALPASVRQEGAVPVYGSGGIVGQHALGLVQGPAVIVGRKGTVGSVYWSEAPCFAIDTTFIAVPHAPHTLEYVHEALKSAPLAETNADSAVPGLNRMEAYATPIAIPNLQSETEFASKAAVLRRRALGAEQESRALTATRDALLPALMSGRLTVRDAEALAEEAGL